MLIPQRTIVLFRPVPAGLQARLKTVLLEPPSREALITRAWQRLGALEAAAGRAPLLVVERQNALTGDVALIVCDAFGNPFGELISEAIGVLDEGAKRCADWLAWWAVRRGLWLLIHGPPTLAFAVVFEEGERPSWHYALRLLHGDYETLQWTTTRTSH